MGIALLSLLFIFAAVKILQMFELLVMSTSIAESWEIAIGMRNLTELHCES
jgi:hypothetical protein